jgi:hypothetical protein
MNQWQKNQTLNFKRIYVWQLTSKQVCCKPYAVIRLENLYDSLRLFWGPCANVYSEHMAYMSVCPSKYFSS